MAFNFLETSREDGVERVTLNRPDVRNAFNDQVVDELRGWAESVANDSDVRAVVLAGAGPSFCAGADISWMKRSLAYTVEENLRDAAAMSAMFEALNTLPFPLIGRVHGAALGGGAGLAAVCDLVIAAEETTFGFTETRLGILPAVIAPYALAKIGTTHARRWFLSGQRFDAETARAIGLVHVVVPAEDLDRAVNEALAEILAAAPGAVAVAKHLIAQIAHRPATDVQDLTTRTIARQRVSPEGQEGLRAFLEKRKPRWQSGGSR